MTKPHSNRDLRQRIESELAQHPSLETEHLRIAVHEGIVTLHGHVPSYPQKQAVEDRMCPLPGVKGVANELEVQLPPKYKRKDAVLAEVARNELRHTVRVPDASIQVEVEDGCITLRGTVDWAFQCQRAEQVLHYLIGVKTINNLLQMKTHTAPDNLRQQIHQALDRHVQNEAQRIRVRVHEGTVTLSGTVDSWTARDQVVALIQALPGVTEVDNQLAVSRTAYA